MIKLEREAFRLAEKYYKKDQKSKNHEDACILEIVKQRMIEGGYEYMWELLDKKNYKEYEKQMLHIPEKYPTLENTYDFLKNADTYYLATVEGDQPRVRPFGTVNIFDGKLYIQTGKVKPVSKQLMANPKAEICAFKDGKWLRVACELIEDDSVEARKSMLDAYPNLRSMYDENDGNTQVFYMKNAVATFSSFTEAPVSEEF